MVNQKETIANANSSGIIKDFYASGTAMTQTLGRKPDFNPNVALKVIKKDPTIKGAMITMSDKVLETPWQIVARDRRSKKVTLEKQLEDLRFNSLLRKVVLNLILYGNAFVEIVKKKGKVTDLNLLETTHMEILSKDNGDVTGYQQRVVNKQNKPINWKPEQVVHFKLTEITTNVWAEVDLESIYETVLIKDKVRDWIRWFFETNQARGFYSIKSANSAKVKDFLSHLKASERDLSKPIIAQGDVSYQLLRNYSEEGRTMNELLLWTDTQLLALLQVPPIAMGFPDMSGRSNSVEQYRALNTRVRNIQRILEDQISYDLFPILGYQKAKFEFGAIDDQQMKSKMEVVKTMRDSGFTNEAIDEWLKAQNIIFKTQNVFSDDEVEPVAEQREKKGEGEPNRQLDEISTREDQLVANSNDGFEYETTEQWKEYIKDE